MSLRAIGMAEALNLIPLLARQVPDDPVEIMGLRFPNRVGLAAGLDKDAKYIRGLGALGFGFLEVGTVTPRPQPGNPGPRLFRLPDEGAIINRMGFNNDGVDALVRRVKQARAAGWQGILGINLGKNVDTPVERALDDYQAGMAAVYALASYLVVNISSPNTPGLRSLQTEESLPQLLAGLKREHQRLAQEHGRSVPLLIKIAPDMEDDALGRLCEQALSFELDGVIVSNTTLDRDGVAEHRHGAEQGGLSGAPLRDKADHALGLVASAVKGTGRGQGQGKGKGKGKEKEKEMGQRMAVIGVGGIMSGEDALRKIDLGADLVQIYTGLIYQGPDLIFDSVRAMQDKAMQNRAI